MQTGVVGSGRTSNNGKGLKMSKELKIWIESITEDDYDGNPETTKNIKGCISDNGSEYCIGVFHTEASSVENAMCVTNFKNKLTGLSYIWDTEYSGNPIIL